MQNETVMITIPRFIVLVLTPILFIGLAILPYAVFVHSIDGVRTRTADGNIYMPAAIAGMMFLLLFVYLGYRMANYFTLFWFNEKKRELTVVMPFLFRKKNIKFDQVIGFHFSSFNFRGQDIKVIVIKSADGSIYKIGDFEISNFRQIEKYLLDNFDLMRTDFETKFTPEEKMTFLKGANKKFDLRQSKDSRFIFLILIVLVAYIIYSEYAGFGIPERKLSNGVLYGVWVLFFYFCYKFLRANRNVKELTK